MYIFPLTLFRAAIGSQYTPMPPNVVIQGTGEDTVSRRPQRGREQALVDDPSKVNAKKA